MGSDHSDALANGKEPIVVSYDAVSLLLEDHEQAREALRSFAEADPLEWSAQFAVLAGSLSRHEEAEEVAVHSVLRDEIPGGGALAAIAD
jgi:hypothetical protein